MLQRLLPATAVILSLVACSAGNDARYASTGQSSSSNGFGVSGGGFDFSSGEPSFMYGTVLNGEARRFTYLVVAEDLLDGELFLDYSLDGKCESDGATVNSDHTFSFEAFTVQIAFEAAREGGEVAGATTSINGAEADAGQWLFAIDADDPNAEPVAVDAPAPELPEDLYELGNATREVVRQLCSSKDEVRTLLGGS